MWPNFVIKVKSVTPQRVYLQPVASVSSQEIGNITGSLSSLGYSQADMKSPEYNKYSANYARL